MSLQVLGHFCCVRQSISATLADSFALRRAGTLVDEPSFVDLMEAHGYDPTTLVFSMRRKGAAPPTEIPADVRMFVEDAQKASVALRCALDGTNETKGVYILDEDDHEALEARLSAIEKALAAALDLMDGRVPPG